jgi:hypothetical protein
LSIGLFLICFAFGAGAIAIWFEVRFPHLAPSQIRSVLIQVGIAMVCGRLIVPPVMQMVTGSASATLVALIIVVLPALVYGLLTALWMLKILQRGLSGLH